MKRYRLLMMAVLLTLVGRTLADNLTVETVTMSAGETKQVAIVLNNPDHQYAAFQFDLKLPEGVNIANNAKGKPDARLNDDRKDDHTLTVTDMGGNTYRFLSFSLTNAEYYGTGGALVYVTLQAAEGISAGDKTVTIQSQVFTEVSGTQYKWGDTTFKVVIGGGGSGPDVPEPPVTGGDMLTVEAISMSAGETKQVAIELKNPDHQYAAFQFDLVLPEGVSIPNNTKGKPDARLNDDRKDDHSLTVTDVGGNTYRFLSFSLTNAEYYGKSGALVYVTLQAAEGISEGVKTATIQSQVFTEVSGTQYKWADKSFQITIEAPVVPVAVKAKSYTREYGEANPTFGYTSEGAALIGTPEITCEATATSPVGTYPIIIKKGSVTNSSDSYVNGTLTITKAPLTISGGEYNMKQGDALPTFKASYSGFKNGETSAVLTKQPTLTTTATSSSAPGTYEVKVSGAEAKNYEITYKDGTLTITDADPITVTVKSVSREYGGANPTFEYTVKGGTLDGTPDISCTATAKSDVGTYDITIAKGTVKNYNVTFVGGKLTITKAQLTISGGTYTMKQGDALPTFKATYSGWKNGDTEAVLTKQPTLTTTATSGSAPGTYDVTVSGVEAKNYEIKYVAGTLTITEADAIVVTVKSVSREYGEANPTFEYTVEGGTLDGMPEISCTATAKSDVGTYDITIAKGTVKNYNVTFVGGKLTITKAQLTISGGTYTMKQGDALPTFKATYSGWKNGDTEAVLTKKPALTTTATSSSSPGSYDVTVSGAEAKNYDIKYVNGTLTITDADPITVTVKSVSREYGEANPTFEYTVEGGTLDGTPEISCTATAKSDVGTYDITIAKGTVKNYNVSFVGGKLTITKAQLTISGGTYTMKQGDALPTFKAAYSGFKNGETEAVLTKEPTLTTTATSSSAPGSYDVTVSGAEAKNYEIKYVAGTLTITDADPITVTVKSVSREYGEANPTFEYTVEGGTLDGTPEISCTATAKSDVGTYDITIAKGTVKNYNVTFVGGTLTITKAPLTISGGTYTMQQGDDLPTFKASYSGFKNGETEAVLTKEPTLTTTATSSSSPGSYDVTVSGAEATNYDIKYVKGTLTITDAEAVVVTAKNYTRVYGEANPTFEFTSSGATLNGTPEITCEAKATSPVGTYPIVIKKGGVTNYNDSYVNSTLTITKAPLTISAGDYTMKQGDALPTFKASYSGFKNGETEAVLTKQPTLTTTATSGSAPGTYDVNVSGAEAKNYEITYKDGTLTITDADPITVTVKSVSREYGDANPTFEYTVEGGTLDGTPEISCTAMAKSDVGTYDITIAKGTVKNYNVSFVGGKLTITKAQLTISGGTYTMKQGDALPTFKATYSGWKNDDTEAVLTKEPTLTTTATSGSAPGTYDVNVSGAEAKNYEIKYVAGTLTITEADAIVVTVKSVSREYGEANPTFEYTVEGGTLDGTPEISCTATAKSDVGTYDITIAKGTVKNYNVTFVGGKLTITKAQLTISGGTYTMKQGDALPTFKATYSGWKNDDTEAVLTKEPTLTTTATSGSAPGTYDVTVSGAEAKNYEIKYVAGKLIITEADAIVVTVKSVNREYGEANPTFEYTVEGGTLDGTPEISCTATTKSDVGTYDITIAKGTVKNYNVTFVGGKLTITKAQLTISGGTYTMKQGDALPTFKATYSGFKNDDTEAVLTKEPTLTTTATSGSAPGTYDVTVSGAEAKNYEIKYVAGKLIITEADAIVVTVKSVSREYGEANPTFEYTVEGGTLDGTPEISCTATAKSDVGTYDITIAKGTVKNYNVTFVGGKLTITKAQLTISGGTYTMKQGDALPTFKATYSGWKNGDTEAVLTKQPTLTTTATSGSAPGTYDVTVSGAEAKNYEIKYVAGKLIITEADAIVVTVKSVSREYGEANPTFEYTVEGGTLDGMPEISCSAMAKSDVGTYDITIAKGTVKNYNVTFVGGTLTITKAPLTISGGTYTMQQGDDLPTFKASYSGFKNGETEAVLTKEPTMTTTATSGSAPGTYDVTVSGAEAQNYSFIYIGGTLTVTPKLTPEEIILDMTIDHERATGLGYTPTEAEVDFTEAKSWLGVDAVTTDMLNFENPDGSLIDYATYAKANYDGWCNGDGAAENWGNNTKICVKFFEAIPDGKFTFYDMNGADEDGKTYSVCWRLVNGEKVVRYTINVTFKKPAVAELEIVDKGIVASVTYNTTDADYAEQKVTLTDEQVAAICAELGVSDLGETTAYGYNPTTQELVKNHAGYDGWRDANGDFHNWNADGTLAPACVKYTDGREYLCYNRSGMEEQTIKTFWAIANDKKAVLVEIDFIYTAVPDGIKDVRASGLSNAKIYKLNGQKVNGAKKGIYIIDGTKVIMK